MIKPDTYIVISAPNPSPHGPLNYRVVSSRYDFEGSDRSSGLRGHGHLKDASSLHTRDENEANERAAILNEFADHHGFHWRNGRYFKRLNDGSVAIIDWPTDYYDPACGFRTPQIEAVIPAAEWASIVSFVSLGDATDYHAGHPTPTELPGDALREALKPFADCCEYISDDDDDEEWAKFRLLIKDYRRAREALSTPLSAPKDVERTRDKLTLMDCPPGLFEFEGTLCFKTEYGASVGKAVGNGKVEWTVTHWPEAYVVESGEFFWGGAKDHQARAGLWVSPFDPASLTRHPANLR